MTLFASLLAGLPIASGISIFGLFDMNPALFAFLLVIGVWGILNLIEFKRFD
jgi:hypothetical protein